MKFKTRITEGPFEGRFFYSASDDLSLVGSAIDLGRSSFGSKPNRKLDVAVLMGVLRPRFYCLFKDVDGKTPIAIWRPVYDPSHLPERSVGVIKGQALVEKGLQYLREIRDNGAKYLIIDSRSVLRAVLLPYDAVLLNSLREKRTYEGSDLSRLFGELDFDRSVLI